jgi:hypothetical protein
MFEACIAGASTVIPLGPCGRVNSMYTLAVYNLELHRI